MIPPPDRPRTASPKPMKPRLLLLALAALIAPALSLTISKENNTTALNNTGTWVGGAIPGTCDTAGDLVGNFGGHDLFITYSGNFGDSGTIATTGGNNIVIHTMVPEPAAAALGAAGLLVLLLRRRRY
jgi:MYXO-CTERM domain-containing protein